MDLFGKEAARYTGVIMAILVALLSLLGITLTPEDYQALGVIITAVAGMFITLGGVEFIRSKVVSRLTVRKELGKEAVEQVFGEEDTENKRLDDVESKLNEIVVYLQANK